MTHRSPSPSSSSPSLKVQYIAIRCCVETAKTVCVAVTAAKFVFVAVYPQVSLAFQLEPLVGSLIGWAAGVVDAPGWATYVGGAIVLAATCVVTYFSTQRELREEKRGVAALELENVRSRCFCIAVYGSCDTTVFKAVDVG